MKVFQNLLNNKFNIINFSSKNNCDRFSHVQTANFYKTRKNEKISRYIRKAMATLNKDLKNNRNTEPTQCKMTEEGKIVSNEFLEVDFSLSLQCGGL